MSYFMAISFSHLDMVFWRDLSQISFDCRGQKPISVSSNNKTKTKTKQKTKTTPPPPPNGHFTCISIKAEPLFMQLGLGNLQNQ